MKPAKHLPKTVDAALKLVNGAPRLRKMMQRAEPSNSSFINGRELAERTQKSEETIDQKTTESTRGSIAASAHNAFAKASRGR